MTRSLVDVYALPDGRMLVQTMSRSAPRQWLPNGLPVALEASGDAETLGRAVLDALAASPLTTLPVRDVRVDPPGREMLEWLGLADWEAFERGTRMVIVHGFFDEGEDHLIVTPQNNEGPRGGFTPMTEHRVKLFDLDPVTVGRAVQEAGKLATA